MALAFWEMDIHAQYVARITRRTTGCDHEMYRPPTRPIYRCFGAELTPSISRHGPQCISIGASNYNRANDVTVWPCGCVCGIRLLKWLISPSPKSQVMFASAFSWIGDFSRIFGIHRCYATATLLNECMNMNAMIWCSWRWLWGGLDFAPMHAIRFVAQCDVNIPSLSPRGSRSKSVANDYRHGCGLWTLVSIKRVIHA